MRINRLQAALLLGVPTLFLLIFFIYPFVLVVASSLHSNSNTLTLTEYARIFSETYYLQVLLTTTVVAVWVTLITLPFGYCLAYYLVFHVSSPAGRRLIYVLLLTPLFITAVVRTFGWIIILGHNGLLNDMLLAIGAIATPLRILNSKTAVVIGMSYVLMPFMVLTVGSVLQGINISLLEAAGDLGANPITTFFRVTLPLSIPGVIAGSLIVFSLSMSAYVTPRLLSGGRFNLMPMLIFQEYMVNFDFHFGGALSILLLTFTLALMMIYMAVLSRWARQLT
jgi:putative spermidine/putrescine transport system permease protein